MGVLLRQDQNLISLNSGFRSETANNAGCQHHDGQQTTEDCT